MKKAARLLLALLLLAPSIAMAATGSDEVQGKIIVIDGMAPINVAGLCGFHIGFDRGAEQYLKKALSDAHLEGTAVPVVWNRNPNLDDTLAAVKEAKKILKNAADSGQSPINLVTHSWGTVIGYIALTELAADTTSNVHVANFITMGSPLWVFAEKRSVTVLSGRSKGKPTTNSTALDCVQLQVPVGYRGQPIHALGNVDAWTNYHNPADVISNPLLSMKNFLNEPVADCLKAKASRNPGTPCDAHSVYYYASYRSPTIAKIADLIKKSRKSPKAATKPSSSSSSSISVSGRLPIVKTKPASVGSTSMYLFGNVDQNGSTGSIRWFEWGTTKDCTTSTEHLPFSYSSFPDYNRYVPVDFVRNTTYYYRAVAQSAEGKIVYGETMSFVAPEPEKPFEPWAPTAPSLDWIQPGGMLNLPGN